MPQLNLEEVASALAHLGGWTYDSNTLTKEWTFEDFRESMAFLNAVAEMAEAANHHPDVSVNYNRVRLTLSTHSEGGVTEKDVEESVKAWKKKAPDERFKEILDAEEIE